MKNLFAQAVKRCAPAVAAFGAFVFASTLAFDVRAAEVQVVAKQDRYELGSSAYESLNALEDAVRAARPSVVQLDGCGTRAARSLQAATHRLNDLALQIRTQDEGAPACRGGAVAMPVGKRSALGPLDIDDAAVAQYWRQVGP